MNSEPRTGITFLRNAVKLRFDREGIPFGCPSRVNYSGSGLGPASP